MSNDCQPNTNDASHPLSDHDSTNQNAENSATKLDKKPMSPLISICITLAIVVVIRETAVILCQALGFASAGNVVGMISLFLLLLIWRFLFGIPEWLTNASNKILVDSGFAFLPVSAGAGLLIFGLGDELWGIMITMLISTLLPLWGLAKLANYWLGQHSANSANTETQAANSNSFHSDDHIK